MKYFALDPLVQNYDEQILRFIIIHAQAAQALYWYVGIDLPLRQCIGMQKYFMWSKMSNLPYLVVGIFFSKKKWTVKALQTNIARQNRQCYHV